MDTNDLTPEQQRFIKQVQADGRYVNLEKRDDEDRALAEELKREQYLIPNLGRRVGSEIVPSPVHALADNPVLVYLTRLTSDLSKRTMQDALDKIAALDDKDALTLDWSRLRYQHTAAIRARLAADYAPATANKMLSALRGVLKEAWRLGLMSAEDYQRAADIANIKAETLPAGRDLSFGEIKALADVCMDDSSAAGVRDAAIIGVLATCAFVALN